MSPAQKTFSAWVREDQESAKTKNHVEKEKRNVDIVLKASFS